MQFPNRNSVTDTDTLSHSPTELGRPGWDIDPYLSHLYVEEVSALLLRGVSVCLNFRYWSTVSEVGQTFVTEGHYLSVTTWETVQ